MRTQRLVLSLCSCLLLLPAGAAAQVAWDAPYLMPPRPVDGLGVYLVETAGGDLGLMASWRRPRAPHGFGWRVGVADGKGADGPGQGSDVVAYGGLDLAGTMHRANADTPVDVAWVAGAGAAVGDFFLVSLPLGISAGRTFVGSEGVRWTPYLSPRLILDALFGGDFDDRVSLDLAFDLGVDVDFPRSVIARFGATLGDREGLALGVVF